MQKMCGVKSPVSQVLSNTSVPEVFFGTKTWWALPPCSLYSDPPPMRGIGPLNDLAKLGLFKKQQLIHECIHLCVFIKFYLLYLRWAGFLPNPFFKGKALETRLPVLQLLIRFQSKKCNFPHPFSDRSSDIHTRFQTWPLGRYFVMIT